MQSGKPSRDPEARSEPIRHLPLKVILSRRQVLYLAIATAGATLLGACGGDDEEAPPTTAAQATGTNPTPTVASSASGSGQATATPAGQSSAAAPTPTSAPPKSTINELVITLGDDTTVFDPDLFQTERATAMYRIVWNTPVRIDETGNFVPDLAEKWEIVNPTTIDFTLRKDIKWADGETLDADDFVFTYERMTDQNRESLNWPRFTGWLKSVTAVNPTTVRMETTEPFAPALESFADSYWVYPRHYLATIQDKEYAEKPLGSGPYRLTSRQFNQQSSFEAVPNWWGGQQPFPKVKFIIVPEDFPRVTTLLTGQAHMVQEPSTAMIPQIKSSGNHYVVQSEGSSRVQFIQFPHQITRPDNTPEIDIKEVRQALNYALDKKKIMDSVGQGYFVQIPGPWAPNSWAYPPNAWDLAYTYDPEKAKQLLAQAGYANGFKLILGTTIGFSLLDKELMEACIPYFEAVGVEVEFIALERAAYNQVRDSGGFSAYYLGLSDGGADPNGVISLYFTARGRERGFYGTDPQLDEIIFKGTSIVNFEERKKYYQEVVYPAVIDVAPWIFLWSPVYLYGVSNKIDFKPRTRESWIDIMKLKEK